MKTKQCLLLIFVFFALKISAQVFENRKFEVTLTNPTRSILNPYDTSEVVLKATFTSPIGQVIVVNGFYYDEFTLSYVAPYSGTTLPLTFPFVQQEIVGASPISSSWKIRFSPTIIGQWTCTAKYIFGDGTTQNVIVPGSPFNCVANSNSKAGFIHYENNGTNAYYAYPDNSGFIPIGINLAVWPEWTDEGGSNLFDLYFQRLEEQGSNFVRIFFDWYTGLYIIGPGYYTYFNSKCAYQFDEILESAEAHNIKIQLCLSSSDNFGNTNDGSNWSLNTFNATNGGPCGNQSVFFRSSQAKAKYENLLYYIIARWGYSSSIFSWELFNEAEFLTDLAHGNVLGSAIVAWHTDMASYIRKKDVNNRPITTSFAGQYDPSNPINQANCFANLDYTQTHRYIADVDNDLDHNNNEDKNKIWSDITTLYRDNTLMLNKPFLMGETGNLGESTYYGCNPNCSFISLYPLNDINALGYHGTLWSSLFYGGMGPVLDWTWQCFINRNDPNFTASNYMKMIQPLSNFVSNNVPRIDQQSQKAYKVLSTSGSSLVDLYYLTDNYENKVYGWIQNPNFAIRKLIGQCSGDDHTDCTFFENAEYLTDLTTNRPAPISGSFYITLKVPAAGKYKISWYDTETGNFVQESNISTATCINYTSNEITLTIRVSNTLLNGRFGDVAFVLEKILYNVYEDVTSIQGISNPIKTSADYSDLQFLNGELYYVANSDKKIYVASKSNEVWSNTLLNNSSAPPINQSTGLASVNEGNNVSIYYAGQKISLKAIEEPIDFYKLTKSNSSWTTQKLTSNSGLNYDFIRNNSEVHFADGKLFYIKPDGTICSCFPNGGTYWSNVVLNSAAPKAIPDVGFDVIINNYQVQIYYAGIDNVNPSYKAFYRIKYVNGSGWVWEKLTSSSSITIRDFSEIHFYGDKGFYVNASGQLCSFYIWNSAWTTCILNQSAPVLLSGTGFYIKNDNGSIYYIGSDKKIYEIYWSGIWLYKLVTTDQCFRGAYQNSDIVGGENMLFFTDFIDQKAHCLEIKTIGTRSMSTTESSNDDTEIFDEENSQFYSNNDFVIFPNPSKGLYNLSYSKSIVSVTVYDIQGTVVYKSEENSSDLSIDLTSKVSGIYFIKIKSEDGSILNSKIVKIE